MFVFLKCINKNWNTLFAMSFLEWMSALEIINNERVYFGKGKIILLKTIDSNWLFRSEKKLNENRFIQILDNNWFFTLDFKIKPNKTKEKIAWKKNIYNFTQFYRILRLT